MVEQLPQSPFTRLAQLLGDTKLGQSPIQMALGEPQHPQPDFVVRVLSEHAEGFGRYPPIQGPEVLRQAIARWLDRRYGLSGAATAGAHILPLSGTREGLFLAPQILGKRSGQTERPSILIPNPFYQCYSAAAFAAGYEPVYVNATRETGFLPEIDALPEALLVRTAAIYLCSPSNPEGAAADEAYWRRLFALADSHDFVVLADECYAEIYDHVPPVGALEARYRQTGSLERALSFHSLSKRSSLPGLRSGFVAGDPGLIGKFRAYRNVVGPALPLPIAHASAAVWDDEAHVQANRLLYSQKFELAQSILGNRFRFYRPAGGFFLWLDVGDGVAATERLWREAGVRVLPGAYLAQDTVTGNPGASYIRVALVNDFATTQEALRRLAQTLS
ncbi:MAG TPA: aspartate aminotransferase [Alphaproteobacteria bacterium]|nr:aspartate aminotransferase [Alphaproteobacteria bacterium]HAJ45375.1 aspartate aminotransferase [Alphaproteobacteria bacterium]